MAVIILSILCAFAAVFGSLGNFLVLVTVYKSRTLRTVPDLFISCLAFSDFVVCSIFLPLLIHGYIHSTRDPASLQNEPYQTAKAFLGHCSLVASVTNIFTVTVDRVIAIRLPLKYLRIMMCKTAMCLITIVWIISLAWSVLYVVPTSISYFNLLYYCVFLLVSTLIMYIYIFISAKRQENRVEVHQPRLHDMSAARQKIEKKATKTIFIVVGLYMLCWLPFLLLPAVVNPSKNESEFLKAFPWMQTILACNSSLNPYVYCVRSQK